MIARTWIGRTRRDQAEAYGAYLQQTGMAEMRQTAGNRGVGILRRRDGVDEEFIVVSLWESEEAIAAFAGDDVLRARYYPEDDRYLLEKTPFVQHYTLVRWSAE